MKRTKERTEIELENEERQAMFANEISDAMRLQGSRFMVEPSYVNIENLTFGRLAFHGMNPEIEKMTQDEALRKEEAEAEKREKDVNDEEMAEYYSNLAGTVSKKFATKRNLQGAKLASPSATSSVPDPNFLSKGQKFVQNMRAQSYSWKKDDPSKKRKMMKPNTD